MGGNVGAWEFSWDALPQEIRAMLHNWTELPDLPDARVADSIWRSLRDDWLLQDPTRTRDFAGLLDSLGVARAIRDSHPDDDEFLQRVQITSGLRHAIVTYLISLGSYRNHSEIVEPLPQSTETHEAIDSIPGFGFAPRSGGDFLRLNSLMDLEWSQWLLQTENAVENLLPGEGLVVIAQVGEASEVDRQEAAFGVHFERLPDGRIGVSLGPEELLPVGVTYQPLWPELTQQGWDPNPDGRPIRIHDWPQGVDDAVVAAQHALRWILMIPRPLSILQSDEIPAPGHMLPGPPLPNEVVRPADSQEVISVVQSVIRAMGGYALPAVADNTHGFRMGPWSGWIHAGESSAVLDIVIVADSTAQGEVTERDPQRLISLQGQRFTFGRIVISDNQVVVVGSMPCATFTGAAIQHLLSGLISDAQALTDISAQGSSSSAHVGMYL